MNLFRAPTRVSWKKFSTAIVLCLAGSLGLESCESSIEESTPAVFFVDELPSARASFIRSELPLLSRDGHLSASVTLADETQRALTPSLPAKLTFAIQVPHDEPVLRFAVAVGTLARPSQRSLVEFRISVKTGGVETTCFSETVARQQRNQWIERRVNLARWAGVKAQVTFEVKRGQGAKASDTPEDSLFPLWGNPVLGSARGTAQRANLILISVDCLRPDHMGIYGYHRDTTPQIDALAADGVVFETAVSTSSWTLPTHMSMLTGLTPSFHGATRTRKLAPSQPYLPDILSRAGYETLGVVSGAYLSRAFGFEKGFHVYRSLTRPRASRTIDEALNLLRSRPNQDFFLFLHIIDPHWRYLPPEPFVDRFAPRPAALDEVLNKVLEREPPANPAEIEQLINLYDAEIAYMDGEMGRLFDELKAMDLYESSLIIFTADHGEAFWEHGYWQHSDTLYEEMIRIPMIAKWPAGDRGVRLSKPVSLVDVFPTLLEEAGVPLPQNQGTALGRYLKQGRAPGGGKTFIETAWESTERTAWKIAIRTEKSKYIATFRGGPGDELTMDEILSEELYNLALDPEEKHDLSTSSELEKFRGELQAHLAEAMKYRAARQTGDEVVIDETVEQRLRALGYIK